MKKLVVVFVAMLMVAGVQAKEKGPKSKEQYIAAQQKKAANKGVAFDLAKVEAKFAQMDKNGDGKLTADEMAPAPKKGKKAASSD
jgi:uncharacterized protein YcfL